MAACAGCGLAILDRFVLNVVERSWHAECLRCSDCGIQLEDSCFSRDGRLVCREDFSRKLVSRCAGCGGSLEKDDLVRRARDKVFHVDCFTCTVCTRRLDTGEQLYIVGENRFVCHADFLSQSSLPQSSTRVITPLLSSLSTECETASEIEEESGTGREGTSCVSDGSSLNAHEDNEENEKNGEDANAAKRRGPRTTIKAKQLETLKNAFASTPKPTRHIREQLAAETGLNMRVIQVWFQNRRSKERRMKQLRFGGFRPSRRRGGRDEIVGEAVYPSDSTGAPHGYFPPIFYCDVYNGNSHTNEMGPIVTPVVPSTLSVSASLIPFDSSPTLLLSSECHEDSSMNSLYPCEMKPPSSTSVSW